MTSIKRLDEIGYYKKITEDLDKSNGFVTASWLSGITEEQLRTSWSIIYPNTPVPSPIFKFLTIYELSYGKKEKLWDRVVTWFKFKRDKR